MSEVVQQNADCSCSDFQKNGDDILLYVCTIIIIISVRALAQG